MRRAPPPPAGYERFPCGGAEVVALTPLAAPMREALRGGTLYEYAAGHPAREVRRGRAPTYVVPLPGLPDRVVVRHSWHGGLLAPLTRDLWLPPTNAPRELAISERLRAAGVPTPQVAGFAVYPAGPVLRRADVATRLVPAGVDLGAALVAAPAHDWRPLVAALLSALAGAGARHADLNVKNVLLAPDDAGQVVAHVLDVDRVTFGKPGDPAIFRANFERFARSARKWRRLHGARVTEADLAVLATPLAPRARPPRP